MQRESSWVTGYDQAFLWPDHGPGWARDHQGLTSRSSRPFRIECRTEKEAHDSCGTGRQPFHSFHGRKLTSSLIAAKELVWLWIADEKESYLPGKLSILATWQVNFNLCTHVPILGPSLHSKEMSQFFLGCNLRSERNCPMIERGRGLIHL